MIIGKKPNAVFLSADTVCTDAGREPIDPYEKLEPDEEGCLSMGDRKNASNIILTNKGKISYSITNKS